eukprot:gene14027-biopygen8066
MASWPWGVGSRSEPGSRGLRWGILVPTGSQATGGAGSGSRGVSRGASWSEVCREQKFGADYATFPVHRTWSPSDRFHFLQRGKRPRMPSCLARSAPQCYAKGTGKCHPTSTTAVATGRRDGLLWTDNNGRTMIGPGRVLAGLVLTGLETCLCTPTRRRRFCDALLLQFPPWRAMVSITGEDHLHAHTLKSIACQPEGCYVAGNRFEFPRN